MARTGQDDSFYAGNRRKLQYVVYDDDGGGRKNLAGLVVRWACAKLGFARGFVGDAVITKTSEGAGGVTITDAAQGELDVDLDPEDSEQLAGEYYTQLQIYDGGGTGLVVATGTTVILRNLPDT